MLSLVPLSAKPALTIAGQGKQRMQVSAWLALFSMVLIFAAPLYSKSQALMRSHDPAGMAHGSHQSMSHHPADQHGSPPLASKTADVPVTFNHAECGYCVLLAHIVPLLPTPLAMHSAARWLAPTETAPLLTGSSKRPPYAIAQVRAPPLSIG